MMGHEQLTDKSARTHGTTSKLQERMFPRLKTRKNIFSLVAGGLN